MRRDRERQRDNGHRRRAQDDTHEDTQRDGPCIPDRHGRDIAEFSGFWK
jgi:hypothetical protein